MIVDNGALSELDRVSSRGTTWGPASRPSNKRMQLTKLRAAPERQDKVPPCAPAGEMDRKLTHGNSRGIYIVESTRWPDGYESPEVGQQPGPSASLQSFAFKRR